MSLVFARKLLPFFAEHSHSLQWDRGQGRPPFIPLHSGTTSENSLPSRIKLKVAWKAANHWCLFSSTAPLPQHTVPGWFWDLGWFLSPSFACSCPSSSCFHTCRGMPDQSASRFSHHSGYFSYCSSTCFPSQPSEL